VLVGARVYGQGSTAALARLLPSGALDSAFGRGGVTRDGPRMDAMARDGSGRILVAGFGPEYQVARYAADGALDLSFAGGLHRSDVDAGTEFPRALAVRSDGRILVAGFASTPRADDADWFVERLTVAPDPPPPAPQASGYWMLDGRGSVYAFGDAPYRGGATGVPAVAITGTSTGSGYWVVTAWGDVRTFGDAVFLGGPPPLERFETVTSLSAVPDGRGYWLFTSMGRVFAYGSARHHGDMAGVRLNGPVFASVGTPSGNGYYMVAADGGVFAFGDAAFRGSMGDRRLNGAVVGLAPDPDGRGYWLVAQDGGVFAFEAPFRGSMGGRSLNQPVVGLVSYGDGYLMVARDGGIFNFSDRPFAGSLGADPPANGIVAVASLHR